MRAKVFVPLPSSGTRASNLTLQFRSSDQTLQEAPQGHYCCSLPGYSKAVEPLSSGAGDILLDKTTAVACGSAFSERLRARLLSQPLSGTLHWDDILILLQCCISCNNSCYLSFVHSQSWETNYFSSLNFSTFFAIIKLTFWN